VTATAAAGSRTSRTTTTYVWLILSAITVISWWLAPGHPGGHAVASAPITVAVVLLGFVKGRMIIQYFMEVRTAPRWLKLTTDAWLVVLWGTILAIYLY
jgi:Prokaryotic Cytochrome C oxidase subunit IV